MRILIQVLDKSKLVLLDSFSSAAAQALCAETPQTLLRRCCQQIQMVLLGARSVKRQHGTESSAVQDPDEEARQRSIVTKKLNLG